MSDPHDDLVSFGCFAALIVVSAPAWLTMLGFWWQLCHTGLWMCGVAV